MAKNIDDRSELQRRCEQLERDRDSLRDELNSLLEITGLLSRKIDGQPVFDKVLERALALTNAGSGSLMIIEDRVLNIVASEGLDPEVARESHPRLGEGIAGWVAEHGRPLLLVGSDKVRSIALKRPIKDALSVPLVTGDHPLGVLNVSNSRPGRRFTEDDLDLLSAFASQAAVALQLLRTRHETEEVFISVIQALAEAIDAKDPYTAGHSRRARDYAIQLARLLGLDDQNIRIIGLAALLHDIGKIGVSEKILRKPTELDEREYSQIKTHPVISAQILEPVPSLRDAIPIIRHHHERFDGLGYPAGLKGEEIPRGARILAIIDAFDAIASGRAYKQIYSLDDVLEELEHNRKSQFDPRLLDVFVEGVRSKRISVSAAVVDGQDVPAPPMSREEVAAFAADHPEPAADAVLAFRNRVLQRLSALGGSRVAEKLGASLEAPETGDSPFSAVGGDGLKRYVTRARDLLIEVIGPRLAERLLLEAASDLDETGNRLVLSCLSQIGIEPPRENNS